MLIYNSSKGYGAIPQAAHWLTVILVAVAWTLGLFGDDLPKGPQRDAGLFVHISAGLAVLILLVVRLAWNLFNPPPSAGPTTLGIWSARLGQAAHYLLYTLLIAVPVAGIVLQFARGEPFQYLDCPKLHRLGLRIGRSRRMSRKCTRFSPMR